MIYRAMAWHLMQQGWNPEPATAGNAPGGLPDSSDLAHVLDALEVKVQADGRIEVQGRDVTEALRSEAVSNAASILSAVPLVRDRSNHVQRRTVAGIAAARTYAGVVLEGRDIGTVVFPEAPHKFFLTASAEVRAERRFAEQRAAHPELSREAVGAAMRERDARDVGREVAPLVAAADARVVDTSDLSLDEVLTRLLTELNSPRSVA
jgi:cytidylate kinase